MSQRSSFRLGFLPTEQILPETAQLSSLAQENLRLALRLIFEQDVKALQVVLASRDQIFEMAASIREAWRQGHRVYLGGCGSTGRLSLTLEYLFRQASPRSDQVRSFIAGGDVALVHSLEGFEDRPELGARQLEELGFSSQDLLIASSEGGETPFVLGALKCAAKLSRRPCFFLFCNPPELLHSIERSHQVLTNSKVKCISLPVGPQVLAGSTRLQASTSLFMAMGLALLFATEPDEGFRAFESWVEDLSFSTYQALQPFIVRERETYLENHYTHYEASTLALTVFTDTTERAPTFSLPRFQSFNESKDNPSWSHVSLSYAQTSDEAWVRLLGRIPRTLEWGSEFATSDFTYLSGFDFSVRARALREARLAPRQVFLFEVSREDSGILWRFREVEERFPIINYHALFEHLALKLLLNAHSTLVMGRLHRYTGNLMTYVNPSNGKLVDRACRYVQELLKRQNLDVPEEEIMREIFRLRYRTAQGVSVVLETVKNLVSSAG